MPSTSAEAPEKRKKVPASTETRSLFWVYSAAVIGSALYLAGFPRRRQLSRALLAALSGRLHGKPMQRNVRDFGAKGDGLTDDTAAIQRAIDDARKPGGEVFLPPGAYLAGLLKIYSNVSLAGSPQGSSTLKQKRGAQYVVSVNPGSGGSANPAENEKNIAVRHLTFDGRSESDGFEEHWHLLNLNAVTNVLVEHCRFVAPQGDGIYLGSSNLADVERHNLYVVIRNCDFDGLNKRNRNAISVIDCSGLTIEDCFFTRFSEPKMPGAIDLEPNKNGFAIIKNIQIIANRFRDIGGNVAGIAAILPDRKLLKVQPSDILIARNELERVSTGVAILQDGPISPDSPLMRVTIAGNTVRDASARPFQLWGVKGAEVTGNTFENCAHFGLVSYLDTVCEDIEIAGNTFDRVGHVHGNALQIFSVNRLTIRGNSFTDCGRSDGNYGVAVNFNKGQSSLVSIIGNTFSSPKGRTKVAIHREPGHTFARETNVQRDNQFIGVSGNAFEAPPEA